MPHMREIKFEPPLNRWRKFEFMLKTSLINEQNQHNTRIQSVEKFKKNFTVSHFTKCLTSFSASKDKPTSTSKKSEVKILQNEQKLYSDDLVKP